MRTLTAILSLLIALGLGLGPCLADEAWQEETPPAVILYVDSNEAIGAGDLTVTPDWERMQEERDEFDASPDLAFRTLENESVVLWGTGELVDPYELLEGMRSLEAYQAYADVEHPPYRLNLNYQQLLSPAGRHVGFALTPEGESFALLAHVDLSGPNLIGREVLPGFTAVQVLVPGAEPDVLGASSVRYWLPVDVTTSEGQWSTTGASTVRVTHNGTPYDVHVYRSLSGGPGTDPTIAFEGSAFLLSFTVFSVGTAPTPPAAGATLDTWSMPFSGSFPGGIALDEDGRVYTVASGGMETIRLDPAEDLFRSWGVGERPDDVTVAEGAVFCTVADANRIVYFDPESLGVTTATLPFEGIGPGEIHRGPVTEEGNVVFWIAERYASGLLRFEYDPELDDPGIYGEPSDYEAPRQTSTLEPQRVESTYERFAYEIAYMPDPYPLETRRESDPYTDWSLPHDDLWVSDIAPTTDGKVWISAGLPILFRFNPEEETLQEMETAPNVSIFQGLLADPDGSIWYGDLQEGSIGHFDPSIGLSEVWRIPGASEPFDLALDADGGIWFTDRISDLIGRLDRATGEVSLYALPAGSEPLYLAIDGEGAVWFSAGSGNFIGRLQP